MEEFVTTSILGEVAMDSILLGEQGGILSAVRPSWQRMEEIAARYGTPCYTYDPVPLRGQIQKLQAALSLWGDATIAYSVKTNSLPAVLADVRREGCIAEVVSRREIDLALAAGFSGRDILYNGPAKTVEDIRLAIKVGVGVIGADSLADIDALEMAAAGAEQPVLVGIRICPPRHRGTWSRFGLNEESGELSTAIERVYANPDLELVEIHFHLGTQITELDRYAGAVRRCRALWEKWGLRNVDLNIGGGLPYAHDKPADAQPLDPTHLVAEIVEAWGPGKRPPLKIEPGRFVVAPAMAVLSRVLSRHFRPSEPTVVVIDSGTNHNVMAAFFEHLWHLQDAESLEADYRLCGPLCMEDDTLSGSRQGPTPKVGSLAVCENAGAYSLSLSRDFIQARPPIVRTDERGEIELLASRETLECYPRTLSVEEETK